MTTIFTLPIRVYHQDVDYGGIVHHTNYLHFMERARVEWLRQFGFAFDETRRDTHLIVVCSAELKFLRPAYLDELLEVTVYPVSIGYASLKVEQLIRRGTGDKDICCKGQIKLACVDANLRPQALPDILLAEMKRDS